MHLSLRQLRVFVDVIHHGSITRAAQGLNLTQAAVSIQIKQMEDEVGLVLFDRNKKRFVPSVAGAFFLAYAQRVLAEMREAETAIARFKGVEGGPLTIGIAGVAEHIVPEMLARFHKDHPQLETRFRVIHNREQLLELMDAAEIDISIMGPPPKRRGVCVEAFGCNPLVFACAPHHHIVSQRPSSLAALERCALIVREQGSGARAALDELYKKHRRSPKIMMEVSSNQTIKHSVMTGMGVGFLSLHTISLELLTGLLKVLPIGETPVMVPWNVVHLHSRMLSPAAEAFRQFVLVDGSKELHARNSLLLSKIFGRNGSQRHTAKSIRRQT